MANEFRVRSNWQGGLIEDNPLSSSATTLTSAGLAAVPAIGSTQHLAIVLDPDGINGAPEIIWVTAHTAGATTATIVRGKESSTARAHDRDISWVHTATGADYPIVRSTAGTDGATRTSSTLGALSTPWTVTIPVIEGQAVEISALVAAMTSVDDTAAVAIRRGSTTIYENVHYVHNAAVRTQVRHHFWRDTTPGTGDVVYEIYVATSGATTFTLKNGATLDTTMETTQGKSLLIARAEMM